MFSYTFKVKTFFFTSAALIMFASKKVKISLGLCDALVTIADVLRHPSPVQILPPHNDSVGADRGLCSDTVNNLRKMYPLSEPGMGWTFEISIAGCELYSVYTV